MPVPPTSPPDSPRYALSRRNAGIGDCLVCLGAAWRFARTTGRVLIADWRGSPYSTERSTNLFPLCFEAPDRLAGVPFVGDQRVARLVSALVREPIYWNRDPGDPKQWERSPAQIFAARDRAVALIRSGGDRPERTVAFDACINDGLTALADARAFLDAVRPVERVRRRLDAALATLPPGPFIGLHARHGNGSPIGDHARYWTDEAAAVERCRRAVAALRERLGPRAPVVLCSDSLGIVRALRAAIPGVVRYAKRFRPIGSGDLHGGPGAHETLDDALVEMLVLARTTALVRYPPGSFFSLPAAVALARPGPRMQTVADLRRPWTADDPLAPAVVPAPEDL
ncbi:nodulation protein NodZ [Stella sp.]|uniref:nodulation protein NodZ n=1 Tax=Stella sp. TaxID=2912054 RepID=UPI0035AFEFDE